MTTVSRRLFVISAGSTVSAATLTGCGIGSSAASLITPKINVQSVALERASLNKLDLLVQLAVDNPNPLPLPLQSLRMDFLAQNTKIGFGSLASPVTLRANGVTSVPMRLSGNPILMGTQMAQVVRTGQLNYGLDGRAVMQGIPIGVPIRKSGVLSVSNLLGAAF